MALVEATIEARWEETPTVVGLRLSATPFTFAPGQWIDLFLNPGGRAGGYSMTTSPTRLPTFDLALRRSPRHPITHHLTTRAAPGDRVWVSQGQGDVIFWPAMASQLVLVGAGIGITPLMSMLRHVTATRADVDVQLAYGASSADEIPFRQELTQGHPRLRTHLTVSRPGDSGLRAGRVDAALLASLERPPGAHYVICGPAGLIRDARAALVDLGVAASDLHFERWALGGAP